MESRRNGPQLSSRHDDDDGWLRQVSNLLVVHFIGRLSLETKPHPKSWPTLSIF